MADSEPGTDSSETDSVFNPNAFIHPHRDLKKICPWRLQQRIKECSSAFQLGNLGPRLLEEGTGGTYLLRNSHGVGVGLFKPRDEEPYAENNPKGFVGKPTMRHGVTPGSSSLREVAAFLLDRTDGFVGVPQSAYVVSRHPNFFVFGPVECTGDGKDILQRRAVSCDSPKSLMPGPTKEGSFIEYVEHSDIASNLCASQFPVREVHKIGIFDIRTMNADRNDTNILVQKPKNAVTYGHRRSSRAHSLDTVKSSESSPFSSLLKLVPIDHGYILPEVAVPSVSWFEYCWLDWPQARVPFDKETLSYIKSLNVEEDVAMLKKVLKDLPAECLHVLAIGTTFLQTGAAAGRTLYDIGNLMVRRNPQEPSSLEHLVGEVLTVIESSAWNNGEEAQSAFLSAFRTAAKEYFEDLSPVSNRFEIPPNLPTPTLSTTTDPYSLPSSDSTSLASIYANLPTASVAIPGTNINISPVGSPSLVSTDYISSFSVPKHIAVTPKRSDEPPNSAKKFNRVGLFSAKDDGAVMGSFSKSIRIEIPHSHSCHNCLSSLAGISPLDFH